MNDDDINAVVRRIYDAALDPGGWNRAFESIGDVLGGCAIGASVQTARGRSDLFAQSRLDPDCSRRLVDEFSSQSTNFMIAAAAAMGGAEVAPRQAIRSDESYFRSRLFHDVFRPQGLCHAAMACAARTSKYYVPVGIFRRVNQEDFSHQQLRLLALLLPHLGRAVDITLRLDALKVRNRALESSLDQLRHGVALVDRGRKVEFLNAACRQILARSSCLRVSGGRLHASNSNVTVQLQELICAALGLEDAKPFYANALSVARPGREPLSIVVAAASGESAKWADYAASAILFIADPEQQDHISEDLLRGLFGLTGAQAKVARSVALGRSIVQTAGDLGISVDTARAHMKQIFLRTETRRQAELVRVIMQRAAGLGVEAQEI